MRKARAQSLFAVATAGLLLAAMGCTTQRAATSDTGSGSSGASGCDKSGAAPGISSSAISLGMTMPLTGAIAGPGTESLAGLKFALSQQNAAGGIKGRKLNFTALDDQFDPSMAQANARRLVEQDNVFAFVGGVGTTDFLGILPYINQVGIPAVGMYAPAVGQVGSMTNPHVYMLWANFVQEFEVLTNFIITQKHATSISFLDLPGAGLGTDALRGINIALKAHHLKLAGTVTVTSSQTDYTATAQQMKQIGAKWVVSLQDPPGTAEFYAAAHAIGYDPQMAAQSDLSDETFISQFYKDVSGMYVAEKVAPLTTKSAAVSSFISKYKAATGKMPSMWNSLGYVQGIVAIHALETAPGPDQVLLRVRPAAHAELQTGFTPPITFTPTTAGNRCRGHRADPWRLHRPSDQVPSRTRRGVVIHITCGDSPPRPPLRELATKGHVPKPDPQRDGLWSDRRRGLRPRTPWNSDGVPS